MMRIEEGDQNYSNISRSTGKKAAKPKNMVKELRVDSKGRVNLSSLISKRVTKVKATIDKKNHVVLEPYVEIPARELWVHENPEVLASIKRGLKDAAEGRVKELDLGKYRHIIDEPDDD